MRKQTPSNNTRAAKRHHKKHGDMRGETCLLSECRQHYPGVKSVRPPLYFIEYTDRQRWEELHRTDEFRESSFEFRAYMDARTIREARAAARRLLTQWEFAQPCICRRVAFIERHGGMWDYSSEEVA